MRRIRICCLLLLCAMLCSACGNSAAGDNARQLNPATETQPEATDPATGETTLVATPLPVTAQKPVLQNGETYTGLPALALQDFAVEDPENTRGLSTEKVGYSYGVAKDGAPHETSVQNQSYFSENGYQAFCLDTVSEEKTLYLTFDCGYENGYTEKILDTLKEKNVPAAFFCTLPQVEDNPQLIARMITEGHIVGNHSVKHPSFPTLTRIEMAQEIQGMDDYLRTNFGYSEPFFRFPMGEYSDCALDLVGSIGYRSVFWSVAYEDWDLDNQRGTQYAFDTVTSRLHPGAVILLHSVSPDNANALGQIIDWAREQGYVFKSLRDFPQT
ncbi:MAG TPA: polysaccharide deacetylase family protein [Candidatus Fimenecus stercoravium]|nr:polysaccharide deacetylase family protein [Candidatus Fimenecus stercoravium]